MICVHLHLRDADEGAGGKQSFSFIGTTAFSGAAAELRFANGVVSGDTNGDGMADFEVNVTGLTAMSTSDFVL